MKIGEYRTNGLAVVWMWTEFVALFWKDEHTSSVEIHLTPASHDAFNQWRLMTITEATAWCHGAKAIPAGIPADDWQTRAEEAEHLVREQHMALAHEAAANGALQGQVAVMGIQADRAAEAFKLLDDLCAEQADTLARVREVAERHAVLDVSNGSWKAAARDVAGKILAALEGK